jgi:hypothetical protein
LSDVSPSRRAAVATVQSQIKGGYADREFYTVHDIVSSAVEQTRAISRRCRLASTGIGRRDETFPTDRFVPVDVGSRHRVDLSPRLKTALF